MEEERGRAYANFVAGMGRRAQRAVVGPRTTKPLAAGEDVGAARCARRRSRRVPHEPGVRTGFGVCGGWARQGGRGSGRRRVVVMVVVLVWWWWRRRGTACASWCEYSRTPLTQHSFSPRRCVRIAGTTSRTGAANRRATRKRAILDTSHAHRKPPPTATAWRASRFCVCCWRKC